ncbi:hypothetical protein ID866_3826 [Astraeus odoratus]|nr:hypothetical protein ID866_3826 [Astraeus odoratus]
MSTSPSGSWQAAFFRQTINRRPKATAEGYGRVASPITPRLYLSDLSTARSPGKLKHLGITHVVSAIEADVRKEFDKGIVVMHVPVRDSSDTRISDWFDSVVKFIRDALDADKHNKVLVHCFQGISRSAILVCAYLVATTPMRALESIAYVQAKRGIVAPNLGFRYQLFKWGQQFEQEKLRMEEERRKRRGILHVFRVIRSRRSWECISRGG